LLSPNFHQSALLPFLAMLLAVLAAVATARRRPAAQELFLLVGFAYCGLYAVRNVPLFAIVTAPLLASTLPTLPPPRGRLAAVGARLGAWLARREAALTAADARGSGYAWAATAVLGLALVALMQKGAGLDPLGSRFDPRSQPVAAVEYLRQHQPVGNGFNQFAWGGYLMHQLWPAQRVFIDGQNDFYGEELTREDATVELLGPSWWVGPVPDGFAAGPGARRVGRLADSLPRRARDRAGARATLARLPALAGWA
jgi:hypothetical protein